MNKLEVLYEDNHIIVVKKPANILSQSDYTKDIDMLSIVKKYIKKKYNKPGNVYLGLVHRLDRPVSGIMVFARTSKAAKRLSLMIKNKEMNKKYLAVVRGIIKEDEQTLKDYLEKDNNKNAIISTEKKGKLAILNYKVIKRNYLKKETLVEINLITGRHHQIRIQFASRNYPLCGDQRYGKKDNTQIALCSNELSFKHPITKEILTFKIDYPIGKYWDDFKKNVNNCK